MKFKAAPKHFFRTIIIAYAAVLVIMALFQRSLLYHPDTDLKLPQYYGLDMSAVTLTTQDNVKITAWFREAEKNGDYLVYLHGNAQNISNRKPDLKAFMDEGFGIIAVSYRGFGTSEGSPSEEGLYNDARAAISFLKDKGIKEKNIILYGESLGTGIATKMATEIEAEALVLEAPYTSIADRAQEIYPFIPIKLLLRDNFESIEKIKTINIPVLILHGEKDMVVPTHHGKAVYAAANNPKKLVLFKNNGHNNRNVEEIAKLVRDFTSSYQRNSSAP